MTPRVRSLLYPRVRLSLLLLAHPSARRNTCVVPSCLRLHSPRLVSSKAGQLRVVSPSRPTDKMTNRAYCAVNCLPVSWSFSAPHFYYLSSRSTCNLLTSPSLARSASHAFPQIRGRDPGTLIIAFFNQTHTSGKHPRYSMGFRRWGENASSQKISPVSTSVL